MEDINQNPKPVNNEENGRSTIRPNFAFVKTPAGLLLVINIFLLFPSWFIMAGWRNDTVPAYENHMRSTTTFFLFTTVSPWLLLIVTFVILLLGLHTKLPMIDWPLTLTINCCIWALLLFISSSIIASVRNDDYNKTACDTIKCDTLRAAAAFGFLSLIGLLAEAYFHSREFRSP